MIENLSRQPQNRVYGVAVIGAGINGLSTAYQLCQMGNSVVLLEQFSLLHCQGSSHSRTRITRTAYTDPVYMLLADQANNNHWPKLQAKFGQKFVYPNGFVNFGNDSIYDRYKDFVSSQNTPTLKLISGNEAQEMFPSLRLSQYPDVVLDTNAGLVHASKVMSKLVEYLQNHPYVTVLDNTTVKNIKMEGSDVVIECQQKPKVRASRAVVTAGRWVKQLVPAFSNLLKVNSQTVVYLKFDTEISSLGVGKYPCFICSDNGRVYYSLPSYEDDWVKLAETDNWKDEKDRMSQEQKIQKCIELAKKWYNYPFLGVQKTETCYHTITKSEDFIIDFAPGTQNKILITSTCSGHSFKFGPLTGLILAELITQGHSSIQCFQKHRKVFTLSHHEKVNRIG